MLRIVVLVSGGGTNLQALIDAIQNGSITNARIEGVISNNKNAYALTRALAAGIDTQVISPDDYQDREAFHQALLDAVQGYEAGLIVLAGFLVKIPEILIECYPEQIINVHPSLIPSFCGQGYYGLKVHEAALERGVKVTGATVHYVDEDMDTGPIILQKAVEVQDDDTPQKLQQRVMEEAEWQILPKAVDLIANGRIDVDDGYAFIRKED